MDEVLEFIIVATLAAISTFIFVLPDINAKKIIKNGKKTKGYIFDIEPWDEQPLNKHPRGALKVCVDGKIRRIAHMPITSKYEFLYDQIKKMYDNKEKIEIKGIPVDVYIYKDKAAVDIDSAEVNYEI